MIMSCYHLVMELNPALLGDCRRYLGLSHSGITSLIIPLVLSLVCCEWLLEL